MGSTREAHSGVQTSQSRADAEGGTPGARASRVGKARPDWRELWLSPKCVWSIFDLQGLRERQADVHGVASEGTPTRVSNARDSTDARRSATPVRTGGR